MFSQDQAARLHHQAEIHARRLMLDAMQHQPNGSEDAASGAATMFCAQSEALEIATELKSKFGQVQSALQYQRGYLQAELRSIEADATHALIRTPVAVLVGINWSLGRSLQSGRIL